MNKILLFALSVFFFCFASIPCAIAQTNQRKATPMSMVLEIDLDTEASRQYTPIKKQENISENKNSASSARQIKNQTPPSQDINLTEDENSALRKTTKISNKMIAVMFNSDSSFLYDDMKRRIRKMAAEIRNHQYKRIIVEGFTDSQEESEQELSLERAKAVYDELSYNFIDKSRMEYIGLGSKLPIESNKTPNGRQANRRVEVLIE